MKHKTRDGRQITIRQLRIFSSVAEFGGFLQASTITGTAQSALSRQLLELEKALHTKLFYRHGRGVSITDAGQLFLDRTRHILSELDRAMEEMNDINEGGVGGVVRLGIPPSLTDMLAARLIAYLQEKYPRIKVQIVEGFVGNLREWLLTGHLDLCILNNAENIRSAISQPLWTEDMCLIEPRRTDSAPMTVTFAEVAQRPLILPGPKHGVRALVDRAATATGCELNIVIEMDALSAIRDLVEDGFGCAILPQVAVQRQLNRGDVSVRRIVEPELTRTLYLIVPAAHALSHASETVANELRTELSLLAHEGKWGSRASVVPRSISAKGVQSSRQGAK